MKRIALALVAASLAFPLAAQDAAKPAEPSTSTATPAAASKADLKVGTGLTNKELDGAAAEFTVAPDTKLWAWGKVSVPPQSKVTLTFAKGDKEAFRKELTTGGSPWRVNAYKTFRAADSGEWTARLLGPGGEELASAPFRVTVRK